MLSGRTVLGMLITDNISAKKKKKRKKKKKLFRFLISSVIFFLRLSVVKVSFCSSTKGIIPKICILCVCVMINKRSFEFFICLDLADINITLQQLITCLFLSTLRPKK